MKNKKIKSLINIVLASSIIIKSALSIGNDSWGRISNNNQLCWYKSENGKLLKRCENILGSKVNIQGSIQSITPDRIHQIPTVEPSTFQRAIQPQAPIGQSQYKTSNIQAPKNSPYGFKPKNIIENKNRNQESFFLFYIIIALFVGYFWGDKKKRSNEEFIQDEAEKMVKEELSKLDKNHYCIMHDITLPIGNGTTQIDHIVFSERGIFVIETKSHKGWIFGNENDGKWTQVIKGGKKYAFHSPITQNSNHIRHIQNLTNIESKYMNNIVVFTSPEMEFKAPLPRYVLKLRELKTYIEQKPYDPLNRQKLHEILGCIEFNRKDRSIQTNENHITFVKKRYNL